MKCKMNKCHGNIDHRINVSVNITDGGKAILHPCEKCGLLHHDSNGVPFFKPEIDSLVYFKNGETIDEQGNPVILPKNAIRRRKAK